MKKIILIFFILLSCGCFNYNEIENTAIVCGMGIDYYNDNYYITYEIINSNKEHNSEKQSYTLLGNGKTIDEAIKNLDDKSPKDISLKHLQIILISKNINIEDLNIFINNNKIKNYYLLLANEASIDAILNFKDEAYPINSVAIKHLIEKNNFKKNNIINITLKDRFIIYS